MTAGISSSNLGAPDYSIALLQHANYCAALVKSGMTIMHVAAEPMYPDCCFVEDTVVIVNHCAVITNPGHPSRNGEQQAVASYVEAHTDLQILRIEAPGTLDGGDVLRVGNKYYIGLTDRTNQTGADQLMALVQAEGLTATAFSISGLLHLKTGISRVDEDAVVCIAALANHHAFTEIGQKLIVSEKEKVAANCLLINETIFVPAECTEIQRELRNRKRVIPLTMTEFQKLDGGMTCLSVLF